MTVSTSLRDKIRQYIDRSWRAYGHPVRLSREAQWIVAHASSRRTSAHLVMAHHRRLLARPKSDQLPPPLRRLLAALTAPPVEAAAWLVQHRPSSARTIVHELSEEGNVLSVIKVGSNDDIGLPRERTVLESLDAHRPDAVSVPILMAFAQLDQFVAIRTTVPSARPMQPPYIWDQARLTSLAEALRELQHALSRLDRSTQLDELGSNSRPVTFSANSAGIRWKVGHGDFTPWNVIMPSAFDEPVGVIDFERTGARPPWWDAATFVLEGYRHSHFGNASIDWLASRLGVTQAQLNDYSRWARSWWPHEPHLSDKKRREIIEFYDRVLRETSPG